MVEFFEMTASRTNEDIRGKDIIQAVEVIIAGILILLTISSFSPFEFPNRSNVHISSLFLLLHYSQFLEFLFWIKI